MTSTRAPAIGCPASSWTIPPMVAPGSKCRFFDIGMATGCLSLCQTKQIGANPALRAVISKDSMGMPAGYSIVARPSLPVATVLFRSFPSKRPRYSMDTPSIGRSVAAATARSVSFPEVCGAGGSFDGLRAGEAEAADQHQEHAADEQRGHDEPPGEWGPEDLTVEGIEAAADVRSPRHRQHVRRRRDCAVAPPAAPAHGRTTPRRRGSRRRRRRSPRRRPLRGPTAAARPAGGTTARSLPDATRGSRRGRDGGRGPVRAPGWRVGRPGPHDRGAAARGGRSRRGRGSRSPASG